MLKFTLDTIEIDRLILFYANPNFEKELICNFLRFYLTVFILEHARVWKIVSLKNVIDLKKKEDKNFESMILTT